MKGCVLSKDPKTQKAVMSRSGGGVGVVFAKSTNCLITWADLCSLSVSLLALKLPRRTASVALQVPGQPEGFSAFPEAAASAQEALLEGRGQTSKRRFMANVKNCRGLYCQTVLMLF